MIVQPLQTTDDWRRSLAAVRAAHPTLRREAGGHGWELIDTGGAGATLLVLPGGLASADTAFRWIARMTPRYRVVTLSYPPSAATIGDLCAGLAALLDALEIERCHIVGGSYSGLVAQCLVRAAPGRVGALVLSDTGVPRRSRAWLHGACRPLLRILPLALVRGLFRAGVTGFLRPMPAAARAFWGPYFDANISRISRAAYLSLLDVWLDIDRACRFTPADLSGWPGHILIIEAARDRLFRPAEQRELRRIYPRARVHTINGADHCASLERMDDYITLAERFLEDAR